MLNQCHCESVGERVADVASCPFESAQRSVLLQHRAGKSFASRQACVILPRAFKLEFKPMRAPHAGEPVLDISFWKLGLIAILLAIPLTVSFATKLQLHNALLLGAARCVLQLLALGSILRFLFKTEAFGWVALYVGFMMTVASLEAASRPSMAYPVRNAIAIPAVAKLRDCTC